MAITSVKIHPAIGIARVGNSPDEFFIGPELPLDRTVPSGGYKDNQCRVKRQGARFRIFAYQDDGSIDEINAAEADITWTAHLSNKKAVSRNSGSDSDLTIDPGSRTVDGPNQRQVFDSGAIALPGASAVTVPLGEIRTDSDGHLIVLGGFGKSESPTGASITSFLDNAGWYDDISDGPVTATVRIHSTGDTHTAVGAWVIVAPPKFAPGIDNIITLYDRLFELAVAQGWLTAPTTPSYTEHIYPILQRARDTRWVANVTSGAHTWADPVVEASQRSAIFGRLTSPTAGSVDMPDLQGGARLTPTQYGLMEKWKDGDFNNDWAGPSTPPTSITPGGLDRAALENCVGGAFYPGIEAGGIAANPVLDPSNYDEPFRFNHGALAAGDVSANMALPWQADFNACGDNWWPVPRPNWVIPQGETAYQDWDRDVGSHAEMASSWHTLGFVVRQGDEYVEVDKCAAAFITLLTPTLTFQDVPQGPMGMSRKTALAIVFEVSSTDTDVTLEFQSGPSEPRLERVNESVTVGPTTGSEIATARLWITYETGDVADELNDQAVVRDPASGQTWTINIIATTVPRKVAAVALVLDRSGSMGEDRGDGETKHHSLQEAAAIFVDVMLENDGIALVRYNQDAQELQGITPLEPADDLFDTSRSNTKDIIMGSQLNPAGSTSIGDGIHVGRQSLDAISGYDVRALAVLTDGKENRERWIADVAADINERTYAVGLGTPENTSAPALQTISGNHGGYLLVTGNITGDKRFILQKYFLQILAGISNAEIVMDPEGELIPGTEHRIPFQMTEADSGMDVILLTPNTNIVDFRLQTPNGFILEPWRAQAEASMMHVLSDGVTYYRVALPTELEYGRFDQAGTWHALLRIGQPRRSPQDDVQFEQDSEGVFARRTRGTSREIRRGTAMAIYRPEGNQTLPYSLLVHSYSNLSFRASLHQPSYEPGTTIVLHAMMAESGIPMARDASVWAEVTRPDESATTVTLDEKEEGRFHSPYTITEPGVYRFRVRARGRSRAGRPFQREQTLTAVVWQGGDRDADPGAAGGGPLVRWMRERDRQMCELLTCLFSQQRIVTPEFRRHLEATGIDIRQLQSCLEQYCRTQREPESDEPSESVGFVGSVNAAELTELLRQVAVRLEQDS